MWIGNTTKKQTYIELVCRYTSKTTEMKAKQKKKRKRKAKKKNGKARTTRTRKVKQQQQQEKLQSKCTISRAMVLCVFLFCVYSCTVARKRGKNNAVKSVLERRANQKGEKNTQANLSKTSPRIAQCKTPEEACHCIQQHMHTHTQKKRQQPR